MTPESTIGPYRIVSKLGEGGMGQVWRARDPRLGRDVAIKILPPALAGDGQYMARFEREAQTLAALNHPNIAHIYGIEQGALVMELVEGEDLHGPLPLDAAIDCARQIAAGLEAAHEKGVVHRDLKPANIKVTPQGVVKILDFGLAKSAGETAAGGTVASPTISPTLSLAMTQAGMILGTAAYMSPEQARGKPVDKRADIWAFGVVLYEMLTGRQLFGGGETITDTLASVVKDAPDLNALPPDTPPHIRRLLDRCLRKDPAKRLRDIGEARIALDEPGEAPAPLAAPAPAARPWGWIAATVLAVAFTGSLLWQRSAPAPPLPPMLRFEGDATAGLVTQLALSPDGSRIVLPARNSSGGVQLGIRSLDQPTAMLLPGTEEAPRAVFSPDGEWIAFVSGGKLQKLRLQGGAPIALCDASTTVGLSWGDDGNIAFAPGIRNPIFVVPASGGAPRQATSFDAGRKEVTHRYPWIMPGGKVVLYTASTRGGAYDDAFLVAADLATGRATLLRQGGFHPMYAAGRDGRGFLIFFEQDTLYAMPMDAQRLTVREPPIPILRGVSTSNTGASAAVALSRSGLFVYRPGSNTAVVPMAWIDEAGKTEALRLPPAPYAGPRLSPDGKRLLYRTSNGPAADLWVYDIAAGTSSRLTFSGSVGPGEWSFDGRHILYSDANVQWIRSDGSAAPLAVGRGAAGGLLSFSPDGRRSLGMVNTPAGSDLATVTWQDPSADDPKPLPREGWLATPMNEQFPALSPDGRWAAYASDEAGRWEIFVRPFPGPGGKWQVSTAGGQVPAWSRKGSELLYLAPNNSLRSVTYTVRGEAFVRGEERVRFSGRISRSFGLRNYDPAPDGKRIIALLDPSQPEDDRQPRLTFLVNFTAELERRVAEGTK